MHWPFRHERQTTRCRERRALRCQTPPISTHSVVSGQQLTTALLSVHSHREIGDVQRLRTHTDSMLLTAGLLHRRSCGRSWSGWRGRWRLPTCHAGLGLLPHPQLEVPEPANVASTFHVGVRCRQGAKILKEGWEIWLACRCDYTIACDCHRGSEAQQHRNAER